MKLKQISELPISHWHRIAKAIYSVTGIAPCVHCMRGGQYEAHDFTEDLWRTR